MNRKLIIYLDNCCYGRRFDDKTNLNVKEEADRIRHIIRNRAKGRYAIIGSFAVKTEIGQITDNKKRRAVESHYKKTVVGTVKPTAQIITRAVELELKGLRMMDSRHLAAAEAAGADYLLTTDMDFIKKCSNPNFTTVKVINPLNF